jgi:hypothetical protein
MEFRRLSIAIACVLSSYGFSVAATPSNRQDYSSDEMVREKTSSSPSALDDEACVTDVNGMNTCRPKSPMRALTPDEIVLIMGSAMDTTNEPPINVTATRPPDPPPADGGNPGGGGPGSGAPGDHSHCIPLLGHANRADASYVYDNEGGIHTEGYLLPADQFSNSGVTIGAGVDLGQQSAAGLQAMGVAQGIIDAVSPYLGLRGQAAADAVATHGKPTLSSADASALSTALFNHTYGIVQAAFDAASPDAYFDQLPEEAQSAVVDVAYPNGPYLATSAPKFWGYVVDGNWGEAVNELQNWYGDGRQSDPRYQADATKLNNAISQQRLPTYDTDGPCQN